MLLVITLEPQLAQKTRSSPLPAQVSVFGPYEKLLVFPLNTVKSVSGTATIVAISPPDARLQSVQWQFAMKVGSASNPYVTWPQAQRPVYFLSMSFSLTNSIAMAEARLSHVRGESLNSLGRGTDHVEDDVGVRQHRNVAARDFNRGRAHALGYETLEFRVYRAVVLGHDVPARLGSPCSCIDLAIEQVDGRRV